MLNEISQILKKKYHMISFTCGILKKTTKELIQKTEAELQIQKINLWLWDRGGGGVHWKNVHTTMYKIDTNKDVLYSAGNSTQYSVMIYTGKEAKKEQIYV